MISSHIWNIDLSVHYHRDDGNESHRGTDRMKLVVAITGASGVQLGKKFIDYLPEHIEAHVVVSDNALTVESFENKQVTLHSSENIAASISSGSFSVDATAIIPCSMNTLAKVACGISDNLPTRVAAVALKEMEKFIIGKWYDVLGIENSLYERWEG